MLILQFLCGNYRQKAIIRCLTYFELSKQLPKQTLKKIKKNVKVNSTLDKHLDNKQHYYIKM